MEESPNGTGPVSYTHLSVLKKYVIQGYAINEKRLQALERADDIQTKMLACILELEESDILKAVTSVSYTHLDVYKRQTLLFVMTG